MCTAQKSVNASTQHTDLETLVGVECIHGWLTCVPGDLDTYVQLDMWRMNT